VPTRCKGSQGCQQAWGKPWRSSQRSRAARKSPLAALLEKYIELKQREWQEYVEACGSDCTGVTEWEIARYLER